MKRVLAGAGSITALLTVIHAQAYQQPEAPKAAPEEARPAAPAEAKPEAAAPKADAAKPASNVTVYGRLDVSLDRIDTDGAPKNNAVVDNASRLGFRGTEDLGRGLRAVFGIEYGFGADTGAFASASTPLRNSYVGLVGPFGAVVMGRLDSANPTGSPLYSQNLKAADPVVHDAGATAFGTDVLNSRNRVSNAVGYMSPNFSGVTVRARGYLAGPAASEDDGKKLDIAVNYENGPVYAGVGYGKNRGTTTDAAPLNNLDDKFQVVGSYDFGTMRAYGILGQDKFLSGTNTKVGYWLVGGTYEEGPHVVTANLMEREKRNDADDANKCFQIGYSHALSKRTRLYVLHDSRGDFEDETDAKTRTFSAGIQHNF
jgi:predicted porin